MKYTYKAFLPVFVICIYCLLPVCIQGQTYYVSALIGSDTTGEGLTTSPWATIQYAIDHAIIPPAQTVTIVCDRGIYTENIIFRNRIHVIGGYNASMGWSRDISLFETLIEAADSSMGTRTITMAADCRIEGCTISDGFTAIYCDGVNPEIYECIITNNTHYGIMLNGGASPRIERCSLSFNKGGILCSTDCNAVIISNTITKCNEQGIYCSNASPTIYRNMILENYSSGVYLLDTADPMIVANKLIRNHVAGVYSRYSYPQISNNFILGNGVGVQAYQQSSLTIENNTIYENQTSGVSLSKSDAWIQNNIFSKNQTNGIEENDDQSDPQVIYNCFYQNAEADYIDEGTSPVIGAEAINTIVQNAPQVCAFNIGGNPAFVDPGRDNLHLALNSVCIDAATTPTYFFDIDLEPRPFDIIGRDSNGIIPDFDIGADELVNMWGYDFESGAENWTFIDATPFFSAAQSRVENGALVLQAVDWKCFSSWTSAPDMQVFPGYLYRFLFTVSSDQPDRSLDPGLRLRINRNKLVTSAEITASSLGAGELSPTVDGTTYTLYAEPLQGPVINQPDASDRLLVSFDIMNFDPTDARFGTLFLESVAIDVIDLQSIEDEWTTPTVYDFSDGAQGWITIGAPGFFDLPQYFAKNGALYLTSTNNTNTFGAWTSPVLAAEPGNLYRSRYYVTTDQYKRSFSPAFRLRMNSSNNQASSSYSIYSLSNGDSSPQRGELIEYHVYMDIREPVDGALASFDLMNFDPTDAYTGEIILGHYSLEKIPLSILP